MRGLFLGIEIGCLISLAALLMCLWASICNKLFNGLVGFLVYFCTTMIFIFGLIGYLTVK